MNEQEETADQTDRQSGRSWWPAPIVLAILILTTAIELILQASDLGLIGNTRWRAQAYENGAFWIGLLDNWRPNYALQPWAMFISYQGLHAGITHLLGNMLVLLFVGNILVQRVGQIWFFGIYVISGIGGALGFALLSDSTQPMVGASGALFGIVGAWKWQDWFFNSQAGYSRRSLLVDVIGLIILNFVLWFVQDGQLAWESHLAGFLTGWLVATLVIPRRDETEQSRKL